MTFYEDLVSGGREHADALVRVQRGVDRAVVTLDDPDKLNVLSAPLVQQLKAALEELLADRAIRAIVLTGADPGFSAGGDLRMMADTPTALGAPEVGTSWAITRRLGYQGAFAYYAGGEQLDAQRARELGLVHEVVAHEQLLDAADAWCTRICALPAHALAMTKPLLRAAADGSWESTLAMEEFAEPQCFTTGAFQEAVRGMLAGE
jgi:enoyl-CoA hydratase/carnithine racemase